MKNSFIISKNLIQSELEMIVYSKKIFSFENKIIKKLKISKFNNFITK